MRRVTDRVLRLYNETPRGGQDSRRFGLKRLSFDKPANTLTKGGNDTGVFHPDEPRWLVIPEMKRLASFPDQFNFLEREAMDEDKPARELDPLWKEATRLVLNDSTRKVWDETQVGGNHHRLYGHIKVDPNRSSVTLTKFNGKNVGLFHPAEPRRVNAAEYARLGSFPGQFRFDAGWINAVDQIGNCVPPLLMRAVAEELAGIKREHKGETAMKRLLGTSLRDVSKTYVADLDAAWAAHLAPRSKNAPTVASLFAGCGGSSLGYSMAGYREVFAVEWDKKACATFRLNFPDVLLHEGDIALLTNRKIGMMTGLKPGELDVLDGSPPCQGFSTAGKRMIDDPRNQLFREYIRILRYLRPKKLVMENVTGMIKGDMLPTFHEIMRELRSCGYNVKSRVLNAMHYGVPQARQRVIFIGSRVGEPEFPAPWSEPITVRDAWAGLDFATGAPLAMVNAGDERNVKAGRRRTKSLDEPAPTLISHKDGNKVVVVGLVTGGNERHTAAGRRSPRGLDEVAPTLMASGNSVVQCHFTEARPGSKARAALDKTGEGETLAGFLVSRRLASGCVAPTLQTGGVAPGQPGSSWPSHPTEPRGISLEEAARLAAFPDQFMFVAPKPGSKMLDGSDKYRGLAKAKEGEKIHYAAERLAFNKVAKTIRTGDGHPSSAWFSHPTEMRGISLVEAKRIGSFPDQFGFGDWKAGCRQIGNCVPPLLIRAVAEALERHGARGEMSDFQAATYAKTRRGAKAKAVLGLFTRLAWSMVAPTVMRQFGVYGVAGLYHPDEPRPLTVGEYKRLASFPDGFKFGGWLDAVAQMGNCVPPLLVKAVADLLRAV